MVNLTAVTSLAGLFCLKLGIGVRVPLDGIDLANSKPGQLLHLSEKKASEILETFRTAFAKDRSLFMN